MKRVKPPSTRNLAATLAILTASLLAAAMCRAADCNGNGVDDLTDIASGTSRDCNSNGAPDECDLRPGSLSFDPPREYILDDSGSPRLADLDGDGDLDVALSSQGGDRVIWSENRGGGSFLLHGAPGGGSPAYPVEAADLDGDGDIDLVARNKNSGGEPGQLIVAFNQGKAIFGGAVTLTIGVSPGFPVIADLDRDGRPDLATLNRGTKDVSLHWNLGGGKFSAESRIATGDAPMTLLAADLDGDGDLELAMSHGEGEATLSVLRNSGNRSFSEKVSYQVGNGAYEIAAGDLDENGSLDLVTVNDISQDVSVLLNRGDGEFSPAKSYPTGRRPNHLLVLDLDGDGSLDLVTTGADIGGSRPPLNDDVSTLRNRGDGTFAPAVTVKQDGNRFPFDLAATDVDADGDQDILIANQNANDIAVFENRGGSLEPPVFLPAGGQAIRVRAADLDGDRDLDLVAGITSMTGFSVLLNVTSQSFTQGCADFLRGDVNSDGGVSISDVIMLRRALFDTGERIGCEDAADASDDESVDIVDIVIVMRDLFLTSGWTSLIPAPFPDPGFDPTADPTEPHASANHHRLGCLEYQVVPPEQKEDLLRLGDASAAPGLEVRVPIFLSASVPVDASQLVVKYDPDLLEIRGLDYRGSFYEQFLGKTFEVTHCGGTCSATVEFRPDRPGISMLAVHPAGLFTAAIGGDLVFPGFEVPPGKDVLLGSVVVRVSERAEPGTQIRLFPTNGTDGLGTGPFSLRNEISFQGQARFLSVLPRLEGAVLAIVGDQTFFRADSNGDGKLDLSDPVHTLAHRYLGGPGPECEDAADANDDGLLDLTDAVYTLGYLFLGGPQPPEPYPGEGRDPTADPLHCYRLPGR